MACVHEDDVLRNVTNHVDPAFKDNVQVAELDWEHTDECARLSDSADVVIGADIVSLSEIHFYDIIPLGARIIDTADYFKPFCRVDVRPDHRARASECAQGNVSVVAAGCVHYRNNQEPRDIRLVSAACR
ncbi:hypothetical protein FBU31_003379 [Coemansia sp. 'formosensis']|nr:hypothetical protein FBU31_003379 [Coemansia sp. 'formosensis']